MFWILVWIMMILAFGTAWTFIVKGCESLDEGQLPADQVDNHGH